MIPFNLPTSTAKSMEYIKDVLSSGHCSGDGKYTKLCNEFLRNKFNADKVLLCHSCTAALEMAAILAGIAPGDEVIMPSYTFVSTANAFVLQGATPVFVDIKPDTLNIDENLIEKAITDKTKAIVPVHYAGVGCEMDTIMAIAEKHGLMVIEDAAQAFAATYKGRQLGTIGHLGCFSFHETKNIMSGEGGCLVINDPALAERAEIIREKGTNRSKFFRGQVDKYTWVDKGSSYLPSDIIAAYLFSILEKSDEIQQKRVDIWNRYYDAFAEFEKSGLLKLPCVPDSCSNNAHMFYIRFTSLELRSRFIQWMKENSIYTPFHYIPLHSAPAGMKFGRSFGSLPVTELVSDTLVRLPLFYDLTDDQLQRVLDNVKAFLRKL